MECGKPSGGLSRALQSERTRGRRNPRMNCVVSSSPNRFFDREIQHHRSNLVRKAGLPSVSAKCQLLQLSTVQGLSPQRRRCACKCEALAGLGNNFTDYSFYQRMRNSEITEQFLWESRLKPLLGYLEREELNLIQEALSLAYDAHQGQYRKSGEPFITHPVEVTRILAELNMDAESLIAGLLHDTVEDCGEVVGLEEIGFHFGEAVQKIVEGETKFSKLPTHHPERSKCDDPAVFEQQDSSNSDPKAQDLQFLFLAMTEEVRIIIVKLADRLHNMRTMDSMPQSKQRRIAQETLQVFSPLARLLGLYTIKEELEELSFKYAMPQQYDTTKKSVKRLWVTQRGVVEAAAHDLRSRILEDPYLSELLQSVRIEITRKALYGTWRKLQESGKSVKDISEIAQLRVILEPAVSVTSGGDVLGVAATERQLCYHTMGLIHSFWAPIPGSMKDYIATPKPNNYQSLHTTVIPTGLVVPSENGNGSATPSSRPKASASLFPIEIQIRTDEMERLAKFGIAVESWSCGDEVNRARNKLKVQDTNGNLASLLQGGGGGIRSNGAQTYGITFNGSENNEMSSLPALDSYSMGRRINWLNSIRQWQEEFVGTLTAQEFVACVTDDLLGQGVFVFTPSGQVLRLPKGSSVVDFAYHIHTDIGNTMVAAKVNGKIVPAEHKLANAEVVEVITYNGPANANIVRRHQQWLTAAQTKSARHKIMKFLKEHSDTLQAAQMTAADSLVEKPAEVIDTDRPSQMWLKATCIDRPGLLADISNIISRYNHNIVSYSGSYDRATKKFVMEYELEGPLNLIGTLCDALRDVRNVEGLTTGCHREANSESDMA